MGIQAEGIGAGRGKFQSSRRAARVARRLGTPEAAALLSGVPVMAALAGDHKPKRCPAPEQQKPKK
jgi:hypothetical protein